MSCVVSLLQHSEYCWRYGKVRDVLCRRCYFLCRVLDCQHRADRTSTLNVRTILPTCQREVHIGAVEKACVGSSRTCNSKAPWKMSSAACHATSVYWPTAHIIRSGTKPDWLYLFIYSHRNEGWRLFRCHGSHRPENGRPAPFSDLQISGCSVIFAIPVERSKLYYRYDWHVERKDICKIKVLFSLPLKNRPQQS